MITILTQLDPSGVPSRELNLLDRLVFLFVVLMMTLSGMEVLFTITNTAFVLMFLVFIFFVLQGRLKLRTTAVIWSFMISLIFLIIPILIGKAAMIGPATSFIRQSFLVLILVITITSYLQDRLSLFVVVFGMTAGTSIASFFAMFLQQNIEGARNAGLTIDPNNAAAWCLYGAIASIVGFWLIQRSLRPKSLWRYYFSLTMLGCAAFIWTTASRTVFIALILLFAWVLSYFLRRAKYKAIIVGGIILLGATSASLFQTNSEDPLVKRLIGSWKEITDPNTGGHQADESTSLRLRFHETAWELIKEEPLLGRGPLSFLDLGHERSPYFNEPRGTHSTVLDMWLDGGIVAVTSYLFLYVYLAIRGFLSRTIDPTATSVSVSAGIILLLNLTVAHGFDKILWVLFAVLVKQLDLISSSNSAHPRQ